MLNKKNVRILSIVLMVVVMLAVLGGVSFATDIPAPKQDVDVSSLSGPVGTILGIIQWAGYAIAVAMGLVIGIKYVTASPDGKAEVKKTLGFYVAGIAIIVTASTIVGAIKGAFAGSATTSGGKTSSSVVMFNA